MSSTSNATPSSATSVLIAFSDLAEAAKNKYAQGDLDGVHELINTPLDQIEEFSRPKAKLWKLRAHILVLSELPNPTNTEVTTLIDRLAELGEVYTPFHELAEFNLYLNRVGYACADDVRVIQHLIRACQSEPRMDWLRQLTARMNRIWNVPTLLSDYDERLVAQNDLAAESVHYPQTLLELFAKAQTTDQITPVERLELDLLDLDVRFLTTSFAQADELLILARKIPVPSPEVHWTICDDFGEGFGRMHTAISMVFRWRLAPFCFDGQIDIPALLNDFPEDLSPGIELGMQCVLRSIRATELETQSLFLKQAISNLLIGLTADDGPQYGLAYQAGQPIVADVTNFTSLSTLRELLISTSELIVAGYPLAKELRILAQLLMAFMEGDSVDLQITDAELPWLLQQEAELQLIAGSVCEDDGLTLLFTLTGLPRLQATNLAIPDQIIDALNGSYLHHATLTTEHVRLLLQAMSQFTKMDCEGVVLPLWSKALTATLNAIVQRNQPDECKESFELAKSLDSFLVGDASEYVLGKLARRIGRKLEAQRYFLALPTCKEKPPKLSCLAELNSLWNEITDEVLASRMLLELTEGVARHPFKKELAPVLKIAKSKVATLAKQSQFEKTALQRWPTLSGPAKTLLLVLDSIQTFSGFAELGQYGGMDSHWAEKHYNKLRDLGMVIDTGTSYHINPHIKPLLGQESQHAVVSRIVRAEDSSAVKQVFNSQKEFLIYQILVQLCPNHLVIPNSALQCLMSFDKIKPMVTDDVFGYYLRASVDLVVVSTSTYLPMLAIEVDSVWHDTEKQQKNDIKKDELFAKAGIPFMRLRPVGKPSEQALRTQVAEHVNELIRQLRVDMPGYSQASELLQDLAGITVEGQ